MPLSVRTGRICRAFAVAAVLALVFSACTSPDKASEPRVDPDDSAAVLGAAAAPAGKYVSPSGNNSNPGTSPDKPFRTVAYAVKQLNPGDTLYLMEGEFFENERPDSAVVVNTSGRPDAWITITAQPGATPILRSNQSNGIKVEGASYVVISNLELIGNPNGGTSSYSGSGINVDAIYGPAKNHHVKVLNNKISGFGAGGIPITGSSHVEIRNNTVHNVGEVEWTQHSGISILESFNMGFGNDANGYSNYITGNVVYQVENKVRDNHGRFTDGNCIIMDRTNINNYSGRTLIANNLCLDNGGRGIQIFESKHVDVVNNTVYFNLKTSEIASSGGELGAFYSSDVEFANNVVFARNGLKPARTFDSSNIRFTKNLYVADTNPEYNGAANNGDQRVGPGTSVVKSPSTNPNPSNFLPANSSPAVNAGTNKFNGSLKSDFRGAARVAGGTIDVGAFESSSSAPAPTTAPPTTVKPTTTAKPATTKKPTTTSTTSRPTTTGSPSVTTSPSSSGSLPETTATASKPTTTVETEVPRPPTTDVPAPAPAAADSETTAPETSSAAPSSTSTTAPGSTTPSLASDGGVSAGAASAPSTVVPRTPQTASSFPSETYDGEPDDEIFDFDSPPVANGEPRTAPPSTGFVEGSPSPADGARDPAATSPAGDEGAAPEILAFEDEPISSPGIPVEIPMSAALALGLLVSYYRPRWLDRQLG